jgi:hypothetical protein
MKIEGKEKIPLNISEGLVESRIKDSYGSVFAVVVVVVVHG